MNESVRKMSLLSLLIMAFALPVSAQGPIIEYGQSDELRGVTKLFVDTGVDAQQRRLVVREIQKHLPDLEIVSRPEDSDVHLRFFLSDRRYGKAEEVGTVVKIIDSNRLRVLCSFKDNLPPIYYGDSMMNFGIEYSRPLRFARKFVNEYRKANNG